MPCKAKAVPDTEPRQPGEDVQTRRAQAFAQAKGEA